MYCSVRQFGVISITCFMDKLETSLFIIGTDLLTLIPEEKPGVALADDVTKCILCKESIPKAAWINI